MLSAIGSPLVAGSAAAPMATQYVRVVRGFFPGGGKPAFKVGEVIEVSRVRAAGLIAAGKAVATEKPASVVSAPPIEEPAAEPEPKGKKSHARK